LKINAANAAAFSHRAANAIAAVHIASIRFAMDAMLGRHAAQLKMPPPAAYVAATQSACVSLLHPSSGAHPSAIGSVEMDNNNSSHANKHGVGDVSSSAGVECL
jgi:hypothetical protein